ncbi:MAG: choline dehydrogenase [Betaproteobacteria bacterium]|nr:choline dehydrogenase [Betaproteobacteria bacterium]NBT75575.1 choline dehydrogenase [Betaproteobacteria bacterium]NCA15460.1 choline dehydrogenase [Betaproteobacteria bacterium]
MNTFDFIVVGAGSSGCVLAARLSEDPSVRVLLLEAGPKDDSFWIHLPIGYGKTMWSKRYNWCFYTDPEPNMNGRQIYWPRGKTLGGSSAINGLIYIRGQREDFDHWSALGNAGWSYSDLLPYFLKSEGNQRGASLFHGATGPLRVSDIGARHELIEAFVDGAVAIGIPRNEDFNGATQEGVGYYQLTTHKGFRCSTAVAYLRPAKRRENLVVLTGSRTTGLVMTGNRVTGVRYVRKDIEHVAQASREVILSAGALQSPQILMLSGIGPAQHLEQIGIATRVNLPGVGENLQDHLQIRLIYECTKPITTNDQLRSWSGRLGIGLQWLLTRSGPLAVGVNQGGCFARSALAPDNRPDIQFHVATLSADMAGGEVHKFSGFTVSVCQLRPESRGQLRLRSADPFDAPSMSPRYLSTALDRKTAVAAVRLARSIAQSAPMRTYVDREHKPGPSCQTDDEILEFVRNTGATIFHPSGTCKMGCDDASVVDEQLRVRGVERLRVVDCSVMPTLVSGNTNAAAVAIAERAAVLIKAEGF